MRERRDVTAIAMRWGCGYAGTLLVMQLLMVIVVAGFDAVDSANLTAAGFGVLMIGLALAPSLRAVGQELEEERA